MLLTFKLFFAKVLLHLNRCSANIDIVTAERKGCSVHQ